MLILDFGVHPSFLPSGESQIPNDTERLRECEIKRNGGSLVVLIKVFGAKLNTGGFQDVLTKDRK